MEWINLDKERPPLGDCVLVLTKPLGKQFPGVYGGIYVSRMIKKRVKYDPKNWMLPSYVNPDVTITHWMHLPEFPKDL